MTPRLGAAVRLHPSTITVFPFRRSAALGLAVAIATLSSLGSFARAAETADTVEPDTSYLAGETPMPTLGITLEQAQRLGADNSPSARSAAAALRSARGARMSAAADFDPVLFLSGEQTDVESPPSSPFAASQRLTRSTRGGVAWLSPIGTRLDLGLERLRVESDEPYSTLPTERRAHARIDFVQPLLKGFGPAATRGGLRAANRDLEAAREAFAAATLDLTADVENAYWELFAAEHRLAVRRLLRQRAAVFLRDQVLRGRAGVVGPGAVAIARTFLADQETALLDARLRAAATADHLAELMGARPEGGEIWGTLDQPPTPLPVEALSPVLGRALDANPSLRAARADSAAARARERRAATHAWPSVEAFGGYGASGLAGIGRQIVFGADTVGADFDRDFGDAWDQVSGRDYPEWSFGLRIRTTIGWRADRGEHQRQLGQYERAREALRARRLALESAVRAAHRESELSQQGLDAALTLVAAAEEQARIARLEYQSGRGTAYDLVNFEADLAGARLREVEVRVRIARAATELRRLTTSAPGRTPR
jgi:outer membrane protein